MQPTEQSTWEQANGDHHPRTISAQHLQRLIDAYCGIYEYKAQIDNPNVDVGTTLPNPETRTQFANRMLTQIAFKDPVRGWEKMQADRAALAAVSVTDIDVT